MPDSIVGIRAPELSPVGPIQRRGPVAGGAGVLPLGLWADPRFVSLTLGVSIRLPYRPTRQSARCFGAATTHPGGAVDERRLIRSEESVSRCGARRPPCALRSSAPA